MAMSFLKVYYDFEERTEGLSDSEKGRLLLAMLRYASTKQAQLLSGNERFVFPGFKKDIDRDLETYAVKAENGSKGGTTSSKIKQTEANASNDQANSSTATTKNKNKNKTKTKNEEQEQDEECVSGAKAPQAPARRFTPPTVDDVRLYCQERGNSVDPQRFVDFYASKGWKVGSQAMKDWQACVRTWEQRDSASPSSGYTRHENPKNHYEQRSYTNEELEEVTGMSELLRQAREGGL